MNECLYCGLSSCLAASTVQSPAITAIARYPESPTTAAVVWESTLADVIDINIYSGSTFNQVCATLQLSVHSNHFVHVVSLLEQSG